MTVPTWLAADWGTTRLRLWAMDAEGRVLESRNAEVGMARLEAPADFTAAFARVADGWIDATRDVSVVVCGMAGAREGWHEAAYVPVATALTELPDAAVRVPTAPAGTDVRILPGLRQDDPPDVMRGEETKLLGLVAHEPELTGVVLMPGTHDKWVLVEQGRVRRFATALTGETFAALAQHTLLRYTMSGDDDGFDETAFLAAVDDSRRQPTALLRRLFGLRATALLAGLEPAVARARLSGWLLGIEITDALDLMAKPERLRIVGGAEQRQRYTAALTRFGVEVGPVDAEALTLEGLRYAHYRLFGPGS